MKPGPQAPRWLVLCTIGELNRRAGNYDKFSMLMMELGARIAHSAGARNIGAPYEQIGAMA